MLKNAWHDSAVYRIAIAFDKTFHEQRHHVQRGPANVDFTCRVSVTHGNRVVDQDQLDLELFPVRCFPDLVGAEAIVGLNDRSPTSPHVQRESDCVVIHRLIGGRPADCRQTLAWFERIFFDGGHAGRIAVVFGARDLGQVDVGISGCIPRVAVGRCWVTTTGGEDVSCLPDRESDQRKDNSDHCRVKQRSRFACHVICSAKENFRVSDFSFL